MRNSPDFIGLKGRSFFLSKSNYFLFCNSALNDCSKDMTWIFKTTINQIKDCLGEQLEDAQERSKKEVKVNFKLS